MHINPLEFSLFMKRASSGCFLVACWGFSKPGFLPARCRWVWSSSAGFLLTSPPSLELSCWWCFAACGRSGSSSWCLRWGRLCGRFSKASRRSSWLVLIQLQSASVVLLTLFYGYLFCNPRTQQTSICCHLTGFYHVDLSSSNSCWSSAGFHSASHTNARLCQLWSSTVCGKARQVQRPQHD